MTWSLTVSAPALNIQEELVLSSKGRYPRWGEKLEQKAQKHKRYTGCLSDKLAEMSYAVWQGIKANKEP